MNFHEGLALVAIVSLAAFGWWIYKVPDEMDRLRQAGWFVLAWTLLGAATVAAEFMGYRF